MSVPSLEDQLKEAENSVSFFRERDQEAGAIWAKVPDEYTHWIEEQQAWRESCVLMDQSYHMMEMYLIGESAGSEVIDLLSDLAVNTFDDFRSEAPPQAKQLVMCNSDGYIIGDCVLFYLEENKFLVAGFPVCPNWIRYNAEVGNYNVSTELGDHPLQEDEPTDFRFELMGPNSRDIAEEVADGPLPEIPFFNMDTFSINGHEVYALGHQMSSESGIEIFGSYSAHDEIKESFIEAGESYGLKQLGSKAYVSTGVESAWIAAPLPAIYTQDEFQDYREWLDVTNFEANIAISGSFKPNDISDFYLTPYALGYENIINFNHEFIGKDALEEIGHNPKQAKITLVLNPEDIINVYASLFREEDTNQFMEMPDAILTSTGFPRYDTVLKDGETVGVSKYPAYNYNERKLLSLGCIDVEYSESGTEVTVVWGEEDTSRKSVERHVNTEIRATVASAPYIDRGRRG